MLPVIFSSKRPVDGVEVVVVDGGSTTYASSLLRGRTKRQQPFEVEITDLSNPVVIEFINAAGGKGTFSEFINEDGAEKRLAGFVCRFGFLEQGDTDAYFEDIWSKAMLCHAALTAPGPADQQVGTIDSVLGGVPFKTSYRLFGPEGHPQLVLRPDSLF